jgi:hypothetical protein
MFCRYVLVGWGQLLHELRRRLVPIVDGFHELRQLPARPVPAF